MPFYAGACIASYCDLYPFKLIDMANTGVKGRIVYSNEPDVGIDGLTVIAVDYDPVYSEDVLGSTTTEDGGKYEITYDQEKYKNWYERNPDIVIRVYGPVSRLIYETPENKDVEKEMLELDPIKIHENNVGKKEKGEPWLVTYALLNPENGDPVWLTEGNQIEPLTDGAALFPNLTKAIGGAQQSVHLLNLKLDVKGTLISDFDEGFDPNKDPEGQSVVGQKIQEVLIETAEKGVEVKVVVWDANVEPVLGGVFLALSLGLFGGGVIFGKELLSTLSLPAFALINLGKGLGDTAADVKEYFDGTRVETAGFKSIWSLMHARAVIIDGKESFVPGSSISRGYFNDNQHSIHDPRHGGSLLHDVHIKLLGPATEHLDRTVAMVWNTANPSGNIMIPTTAPSPLENMNDLAGVQVIRTLPGETYEGSHTHVEGRQPSVPKLSPGKKGKGIPYGETGPLEAYQRAIALAENFIYIEDQYLTSREIVTALIQRMNDNEAPKLELIIVLNLKTDHPDYRPIQTKYLKELKAKTDNNRLGIFTLWSGRNVVPRYEIMPIYVHSKVGLVDDKWATSGTANLDGASLNQAQTVTTLDYSWSDSLFKNVLRFLFYPIFKFIVKIGELALYKRPTQHANPNRSAQPSRFSDLNLVIYNNVAGLEESNAVIRLRENLWREHLGYLADAPQAGKYPAARPVDGWVKFWKDRANERCKAIIDKQDHPALILEWQPETDPEKYLRALGVPTKDYFIRESADSFNFTTGIWGKKK